MSVVRGTWLDDVFFTEESLEGQRKGGKPLRVEISRQNANLRQVKERLAAEVQKRGGNALVGFTYGQKSHSVFKQAFTFKWDTESWHGFGYVADLTSEQTGPRPS